jgi:hypothetical protein
MTVYSLMSAAKVPVNAPDGVQPTPVAVLGNPTRAHFDFSLSGPIGYAQATVLASQPGAYNAPYEQVTYWPLAVLTIPPGGRRAGIDLALGAPYDSFAAELNAIPSGGASASLTMTV